MKIYLDKAIQQVYHKIGDCIHLYQTPNKRARIEITNKLQSNKRTFDFINIISAYEWILFTYNLRELKHELYRTRQKIITPSIDIEDESTPYDTVNKIAENICLIIAQMTHYDEKDLDEVVDMLIEINDDYTPGENIKMKVFDLLIKKIDLMISNMKSSAKRKKFSHFRDKIYRKRWVI